MIADVVFCKMPNDFITKGFNWARTPMPVQIFGIGLNEAANDAFAPAQPPTVTKSKFPRILK